MKRHLLAAAAAGIISFVCTAPAFADDNYLSFNGGYYDIFRKDQKAGQFGAEYRFSDVDYGIHPIIGGFATTEGSTYGYAGLNWDVPLIANEIYIVPNFAVGAYGKGSGKDLGGVLEFRSGLELDYQFANTQQLGIAVNHISNAGIYSHNPGEETLMATYSVPIHTIVGLFNR